MPPYLAIPHFHLSKLPITTKVAVTCFAVTLLGGMAFVSFVLFRERTGYRTEGVRSNFAGTEWRQNRGEVVEREAARPTERQIYDIIHPHSFLMPVIYFILCHLMEMTPVRRRIKLCLYLVSFAAMLVVTAAPILVWKNVTLAVVVIPAVVVMMGLFSAMTILPVWQMWFVRETSE